MLLRLFLAFTLVPVAEVWLLLATASAIGLAETLLLCIVTGAAGAWLARQEGLAVLRRIRTEFESGKVPGGAALEGALVFAGGLLLLTPGLMTDLIGLCMVAPPTRRRIAAALTLRLQQALQNGSCFHVQVLGSGSAGAPWSGGPGAGPGGAGPTGTQEAPEYQDDRLRRILR